MLPAYGPVSLARLWALEGRNLGNASTVPCYTVCAQFVLEECLGRRFFFQGCPFLWSLFSPQDSTRASPSILSGQKANAAWPKACILSVVSSWTAERGGHHNPGGSR